MSKKKTVFRGLLLVAAIAVLLGFLVRGSLKVVQAECEVCVEFRGVETCRTGSGATREDAERAARRAACAVMAFGMDASIACQNQRPKTLQCTGG
ncbi:MAG: hypothetical protein ACE5PT_05420 [Gemmatimonadales bacterium]